VFIAVENGAKVDEGAVLVELDARETQADESALIAGSASLKAEIARRRAALATVRRGDGNPVDPEWADDIPASIREREQLVFIADTRRLQADLSSLAAQRTQKEAEVSRLERTIKAQQELIATESARVGMRAELMERSAGSKAQLLDAQETRQVQEVTLASQMGQKGEASAALNVLAHEALRARDMFLAENSQKLADAERQFDDMREKLVRARTKREHMTLRSPMAGTVTAMSVNSLGQVVTTGEEMLRIVPADSSLEVEGYLSNADIGFVYEGQAVTLKIDSFPFTRYGSLEGTVMRVAHDAVPAPDQQQNDANPARSARMTGLAGTQRTQNLVFPVTIRLSQQFIKADGAVVPLTPGMTCTAEIKTGQRTILEYLLAPLLEVTGSALKDR